jgi:hypothetical protein
MSLFCCFALGMKLYAQPAIPRPGAIQGLVKTSDGQPAAIRVRAARTSPLPAIVASAIADPSGSFQITGLQTGEYELCFTATSAAYIDPCLWEASGEMVTVSAGATVRTAVTLRKAATLKVHVVDAGKLNRNSQEGAIVMGVFGARGHLHRMTVKGQGPSGNDYELAVPYDRDLVFSMKSIGLALTDERNAAVADWQQIPIRENSDGKGPKLQVLNFVVTGNKQ